MQRKLWMKKSLKMKSSLKTKIEEIKADIEKLVREVFAEKFSVVYYGAYDIDPRYLVYWICVQSDQQKEELKMAAGLNHQLIEILHNHDYPKESIGFVHVGFESQETVDRESQGNWWHHFK